MNQTGILSLFLAARLWLLFTLAAPVSASAQVPGEVDLAFDPGSGLVDAVVTAVAVQADGKIIIGGAFTTVKGEVRNRIARLNSNGTPDSSFDAGTGANGPVYSLALQSDGKILIGGVFTNVNGFSRDFIARLNPNGSVDDTFSPGDGPDDTVTSIAVQTDGKVVLGGFFTSVNSTNRNRIARLNANGTLDTSFDPGTGANDLIASVALQSNGRVLVGGSFTSVNGTNRNSIARLHANGGLDATFNPGTGADDHVAAIAVQADGKILIGGWFTRINGTQRNRIARLNANGSVDASFNPLSFGANNGVTSIRVQPNGRILIGGLFSSVNFEGRSGIARLNANGSLDNTFNPSARANNAVASVALQSDGKVLIGDFLTSIIFPSPSRNSIVRLNANGSLDQTFNSRTGPNTSIQTLSAEPDGKLLIGGSFTNVNGTPRNCIARLNADGNLDGSFNPGTGPNGEVRSVIRQPDGKVLIAGAFSTVNGTSRFGVARLETNGGLDTTFNAGTEPNTLVHSLALAADSKILIGGYFSSPDGTARNSIVRLNANGSRDSSFIPEVTNAVFSVAVEPSGRVLIGGLFTSINGTTRNNIARLNTDGSLDTSFDPGTGANAPVYAVDIQSDGKVLIGGNFSRVNGSPRNAIARLNSNGTMDTTFGSGSAGANRTVLALAAQPDGKVLLGGSFTTVDSLSRNSIARLNADGSLDRTFDPGMGANSSVQSVAIASDGAVLIGGSFSVVNSVARAYVARLFGGPVVGPALTIARNGPNTILISWPDSAVGFELEQNSGLESTAWSRAADAPVRVGSRWEVLTSPVGSLRFYRVNK